MPAASQNARRPLVDEGQPASPGIRIYSADPRYDSTSADVELGPEAVGRLVGELAVHRESFSRVWSGSPEALECILDALITIGAENKPHALEFRLFEPAESLHGLSLQ